MTLDHQKFKKHVDDCIDTDAAHKIIRIIAKIPAAEGRKSGFLTVYDKHAKCMVMKPFGEIPEEKWKKYLTNSNEKVIRLLHNDGVRSYDTRNEEHNQWGGGICYRNMIVGFSGLPENLDETLSLLYAMHVTYKNICGPKAFIEKVRTEMNCHYKDNEFIEPVLNEFIHFYTKIRQ